MGTLYINDKPYGNGFDSSPRVRGDEAFCFAVTGQHGVKDCSFEGLPNRAQCEMAAMHGCPIWQFSTDGGKTPQVCHDDQTTAACSCDHFGDPVNRDDPKTPTTGNTLATLKGFEGTPLACGLQRDSFGPFAGYFTIAHGIGNIRACFPEDQRVCGPWRPFNH